MSEEKYVSLKPSESSHGGGMIAEGRYKISDAKFVMFDYNGTIQVPIPALAVEFKNADEATGVQYYTSGDAKNFLPSEDGKRLRVVGSATGINDSTNCYMFLASLVSAGFSEDKLGADISVIIGCDVEVKHEAIPSREIRGKAVKEKAICVIAKLNALPGEKPKAAAGAKTPTGSTGASNKPKPNGVELTAKTTEALVGALKDAPGRQLEKKALSTAIFKRLAPTDSDRSAVLTLAIQDEYLSGLIDSGVLYNAADAVVSYIGE